MKTAEDIKTFLTVSIWCFESGFTVRGYYRGNSFLIGKFDNLEDAAKRALATNRKHLDVLLVPAKESLDQFAEQCAKAVGVTS